jgi:23S rRNA (uracil1939-C5)-methyltransferase
MYRFNTHEIIAMDKTHLDDLRASEVMQEIRPLLQKYNISIYDEKSHTGTLRRVMIRASYYTSDIMVVLISKSKQIENIDAFCADLIAKCPQITTIVQNINPHRTNVILGDEEKVIYGEGIISDKIADLTFLVSSKSFFQVNTLQAEKLYSRAISLANLKESDRVLDAYSGIGTITLLVARKVKKAIGVEIVKEAVEDAKVNAKINKVTNVEFYQDDAGDFLVKHKKNTMFDVVFVDPPRKGLGEVFLTKLLEVAPPKIVYVSCDPATLSRDLKALVNKYKISAFETVDMFPRTAHVESVVILEKLK